MPDAKTWLSEYRTIEDRIAAKAEQAMRLRALLYGPRAELSDMPKGNGDNDWTRKLVNLIALENEIDEEIGKLMAKRRTIESTVEALPHEKMRTLIEMRYINQNSAKEIEDRLGYSESSVRRLHSAALKVVDKLIGHEPP